MRRLIFIVSVLAGCLCFAGASMAQRACVLSPEGYVVCGPLVQRGYKPPPRVYRGPPPYFDGRHGYDDRRRARPPKCQKGYTVQDGVCKPYTGR